MDFDLYKEKCAMRWEGECLVNARFNWGIFKKHHEQLVEILRPYLKDAWCPDLSGVNRNPEGSLTSWLWKCSGTEENSWIWDFCAHYQKCHLRRGLLFYCEQLIKEIQAAAESPNLRLTEN